MNRILQLSVFAFIVISIAAISCRKDDLPTSQSAILSFSTDTVMFDTIFTDVGSTTLQLKVYNRNDQAVEVSSIYLAKSVNSNFRLNINGVQTRKLKDVTINARDSIFIFVEVTVDPNRDEMVEQDSIVFMINGNTQDVDLVAFGQDVNLFTNKYILSDTVWTNDKPFLIHGFLIVDYGVNLTIQQGTQLHFHQASGILIGGTMVVNGSYEEPVVFQGDRLEAMYDDVPGQWGFYYFDEQGNLRLFAGLHFLPGSTGNFINHAEIKNANIGIRVDTIGSTQDWTLSIHNTKVENHTIVGLYALGSSILATNCVFANCAQFTVALTIGGYYEFYHCTMANYWGGYSNRKTPSVLLNNYYQDIYGVYQVRGLEQAYFGNCIITGGQQLELALDSFPDVPDYFNYSFDHCLIKVDDEFDTLNTSGFFNTVWSGDPRFVDYSENDFHLDTLSDAIDNGSQSIINDYTDDPNLDLDLENISRVGVSLPDLGAYEREE